MSILRSLALLTLAVVATFAVAAPVAHSRHGMSGVSAAAVAAGICWASATAAFLVLDWFRRSGRTVPGVLAGTLLRLGVPLVCGVLLSRRGGPLAEAGVFGLIVVFYLVTLIVETLLSVRLIQRHQGVPRP